MTRVPEEIPVSLCQYENENENVPQLYSNKEQNHVNDMSNENVPHSLREQYCVHQSGLKENVPHVVINKEQNCVHLNLDLHSDVIGSLSDKNVNVSSASTKRGLYEVSTPKDSVVSKVIVSGTCSDVTPFSIYDGKIDEHYKL